MPYASDSIHLPEEMDQRRTLTTGQYEEVRTMREETGASYRVIGDAFGITKQYAWLICHPDKLEEQLQKNKQSRKADPEKAKKAVHSSRKRKHKIVKKLIKKHRLDGANKDGAVS